MKTPSSNTASNASSQDGSSDLVSSANVVDDNMNDKEVTVIPPTPRSPTPTLTVPARFLDSEEFEQASSEGPTQLGIPGIDAKSSLSFDARPESPVSPDHDALGSESPMKPPVTASSTLSPPQDASSAVSAKANVRPVQMVLDTLSTSWGRSPASNDSSEHARKRRRVDSSKSSNPRTRLRSRLISFRAVGTQPAVDDESNDELDSEPMDSVETEEAEEVRQEKHTAEDDELMEGELEEIRIDAEADAKELEVPDNVHDQESSNDRESPKIDDGGNGPLFLPDPGGPPTSRQPATRVKVEPIDVDLDAGNNNSTVSSPRAKKRGNNEFVRTVDVEGNTILPFNSERIYSIWNSLSSGDSLPYVSSPTSPGKHEVHLIDPSAGLSNTTDEESAERELARVIDKEDFSSMEIVGQFNLGFIIARCRLRGKRLLEDGTDDSQGALGPSANTELDDLFIID